MSAGRVPAAEVRDGDPTAVRPRLDRLGYRAAKRAFDIAFSLAAIAVCAVPAAVLCAVIAAESPGSPIYRQRRVGRVRADGTVRTFWMYKFRSMVADADERLAGLLDRNEASGAMFKMRDDPRVTRVGRFIRRHSIDELPQFVNVLLGQMSVVGPRPPLPGEVALYTGRDMGRLAVKPGLTGPWQVSGRSDLGFEEMVELDLDYVERRGLLLDLSLVLRTVRVVLTGEGAA